MPKFFLPRPVILQQNIAVQLRDLFRCPRDQFAMRQVGRSLGSEVIFKFVSHSAIVCAVPRVLARTTRGVTSGFNCALFCTTSHDRPIELMSSQFGGRLVKIEPVDEFVVHVGALLGARRSYMHDVVYTDEKHYAREDQITQQFRLFSSQSALSDRAIHKINRRFFETFYRVSLVPSLFAKPSRYSGEREIRLAFELDHNIAGGKVVVSDKSLMQFITPI